MTTDLVAPEPTVDVSSIATGVVRREDINDLRSDCGGLSGSSGINMDVGTDTFVLSISNKFMPGVAVYSQTV